MAVGAISFFAFYKIEGKSAGLALWQLFGSTNQLLAGLALLVVSLYLIERRRIALPYLIPMLFMIITTVIAMANKLRTYAAEGNTTLLVVGGIISFIAVWLAFEAVLALWRYSRSEPVEGLDIAIPE